MDMKNRSKYRSPMMRWSAFDTFITIICVVLTIICVYPFLYVIACSFSESNAVVAGKVKLWPVGFETDAYSIILKNDTFWRGVYNSIIYAIGGTLLMLYNTIVMAYPMTRPNLKFRKVLTYFLVFQMFFSGGLIPSFILATKLGLYNNPLVMIIPSYSIGNVMVCMTYMKSSLGSELIDSSMVDGANHFQALWKIVVPLSKPVLAVFAMYTIVGAWNGWFQAQIYLTKEMYHPIQMFLKKIIESANMANTMRDGLTAEEFERLRQMQLAARKVQFSAIVLTSAPVLMIYPMFQKHFAKGFLVGSLKG